MAVDIRGILPHRYPFLLVDAFVKQEGDTFECLKNVSYNEPFFVGHFPQEPVMPGVLILEALAQAAAVGVAVREGAGVGGGAGVGYLTGVDGAKFRRKVVPGDQLRLTGTIVLFRRGLCKVEARALVGDEVAAEANLSFMYAR
ncbi:MAG: 3-hydroxyacyl-ACP dehydratase FabZ [Trueperaceae bacterium]|nr:3-hydroxyacyl-ACP dehydratase FabZ [Trueperaceae bacterium]MCO5172754.1 3-hydroxyacyl-ACP dehydratase FabZ [Trueperaceae bacterium]MCW5820771.1 3-hydroxyacyl-ACP dehydratase FabZ [Trueperaceae bacterium]